MDVATASTPTTPRIAPSAPRLGGGRTTRRRGSHPAGCHQPHRDGTCRPLVIRGCRRFHGNSLRLQGGKDQARRGRAKGPRERLQLIPHEGRSLTPPAMMQPQPSWAHMAVLQLWERAILSPQPWRTQRRRLLRDTKK